MRKTNEISAGREIQFVSARDNDSAKNPKIVRSEHINEKTFNNSTAYLEKFGIDPGKYRQTALNFKHNQAQASLRAKNNAAGNSFPKPPVSNRFTADPGNYGSRGGTDIDAIMLHHTAGSTASGAASALNSRGLSAHYVIDKDGTIYQMVGDEKRAYHAGAGSIRGDGRDVNDRSIGIEIVNLGNGSDKYTEAQYKALEKLLPYLTNEYDIPTKNIVGHSETGNPNRPASRPEPSRNFDWERVRRAVGENAPAPNPNPPNPPSSNPPNPTPDKPNVSAPTAFLQRGDNSGQVKKLQDALVELGYLSRGEIGGGYGNFGPKTERAVRAFQRDHRDINGRQLASDGIYGPKTRGALEKALLGGGSSKAVAPMAFLERGDNNSQVKRLQDALVKLGYLSRGEIGNGYGNFGPKTERAVREFQRDHKDTSGRQLVVDGIYGAKTRGALQKALQREGNSPANPTDPNPGNPPSGSVNIDNIAHVKNNPNFTPAFRREVAAMANRLGTKPEYLMAVMSFESGLNPKAVNPTSGATGLIQFLPSTARGLGTSAAALKNISATAQLRYVEKYFEQYRGKLGTLEGAYTAVLSGTARPNPNDVLFRSGTAAYNGNKNLDFNRNGEITSGEATSAVAANMFGGVRRVQQKLVDLGFDPKGVDGVFGPNTSRAIAAFQKSRDLPQTGLMNERTGLALINAKPPTDNNGNRVPNGRPTSGRITGDFGSRPSPGPGASTFHNGIDIGAPTGTRVQSTAPGKIVFAGNLGTAGNAVIIDHGNGYQTKFFHLSQIDVRVGQAVKDNQKIGEVGETGNAFGAHLHYEVLRNGTHLNPERFL